MKYTSSMARYILGVIFFVFGLNGFFQFLPMPPPSPEAGAFFGALFATGYFLPFLKTTEIVLGILFLTNKFVPMALVILAPISLNILAFHLFLDPGMGLVVPIIIVVSQLLVAKDRWSAFSGLLKR